jgi:hypothetical protein
VSRVHVRCAKCRARRVLKQAPDLYQIIPACHTCSERKYYVDKWMNTRNTNKAGCVCAGYWFKHRQGSLYCWHRQDGSIRAIGDKDFADRNIDSLHAEGAENEHTTELEYA